MTVNSVLVTDHILQIRFFQLLQQCEKENHNRCIDGDWETFEIEFPGLLESIKSNDPFPVNGTQSALRYFEYVYNICEDVDYPNPLNKDSLNQERNYYFGSQDVGITNSNRPLSAFTVLYDSIIPTQDAELFVASRNGCKTLHRADGQLVVLPKEEWPTPIIQDPPNPQLQNWHLGMKKKNAEDLKSFLDFVERTHSESKKTNQ